MTSNKIIHGHLRISLFLHVVRHDFFFYLTVCLILFTFHCKLLSSCLHFINLLILFALFFFFFFPLENT